MADPPAFSKSQLADLFGIHRQTVASRLAKVAPCKKDGRGHPLYTIPKAAQWLVDFEDRSIPGMDEETGEVVDPDRLPPEMAKDFWDAQLKKQKYLREDGDLWETQQVVDAASGFVKPMVSGLSSLSDVLESALGLNPKQVKVVDIEVRRIRENIYNNLVEKFSGQLPEPE